MKTTKKLVSIVLSLFILISVFVVAPTTASAATAHTQAEAVAWVNSKVGQWVGEHQCVALIRAYYSYLGVSPANGNGCDYATITPPSGWQKIKYYSGFVAQPGDIAVFDYSKWAIVDGKQCGHVGIVKSGTSSSFDFYDQNPSPVRLATGCGYNRSDLHFWGVVRPDFKSTPTPTTPTTPPQPTITPVNLGTSFYATITKTNDNKALTNSSTNNLEIQTKTNATNQRWMFQRDSSGAYGIWNIESRLYIDLSGSNTANGTNIKTYDYNNSDAQKWYIVKCGSGYSFISKCDTSKAIDIYNNGSADGTNAQLYTKNSSGAQIFTITIMSEPDALGAVNLGDNFYAKIKTYNNKYIAGDSTGNVVRTASAKDNEDLWEFSRNADSTYTLTNYKYNKVMDVVNKSSEKGTNVQLYSSNGSTAQKWYILSSGSGYYFTPLCALGRTLNMEDSGNSADGLNMQIWYINKSNSQVFSIFKESAPNSSEFKLSRIYADNSLMKWDSVYIYGWGYGIEQETFAMTNIPGTDIWYYDLPRAIPNGAEAILFKNTPGSSPTDWDRQTPDVTITEPYNCYMLSPGKWYTYTEPTTNPTESTAVTTPIESQTEPKEGSTATEPPTTTKPSDNTPATDPTERPTATEPSKTIYTSVSIDYDYIPYWIYVKEKVQFYVDVTNAKGKTIYSSSNPEIAKVSSGGKITGLKKGTTTITVTNNGASDSFKIKIKNPKLNKSKKTLKKGKKFTLKITGGVGKAKFTSSNKKVANVNKNGKITAKKKGKATITVKTNGMKLKCKITVK
ncbi:MAG: RICIN domain-containing protein [Ruminococcus sp.]|nr:RICIN domain-containing protein [Ruminococcus sp.]